MNDTFFEKLGRVLRKQSIESGIPEKATSKVLTLKNQETSTSFLKWKL